MRTENSFKNIYMTIMTQVVITILGFVSRKIFIDSLGSNYLGINGLLTNILSMLSLVEGGIGVSITYNLYKPLAEHDEEKITALVQLYKKIYFILAIVIFTLSLTLYPFLKPLLLDGIAISNISTIYFMFIVKNLISYFNAHKWSLINADQKGYVLVKYNLIFKILTIVFSTAILFVTGNYIAYLLIELILVLVQNIWNGKVVNNRYPYIKTMDKYRVDSDIKNNLIKNVKAMFMHKIGGYCVSGTDNILISIFVSVRAVGFYSNYTLVINQMASLIKPMIEGIGESIGNLIATESNEKNYEIFNITYFINFWVYSFTVIFLYNLLEPFINWWLGDGLLLDELTFIVILINVYLTGLRLSILTFKTKGGIFSEDKYAPILESIINLGSSLILVKYFGLAGIFLGTTISTICIPIWVQSKLVYNKIFNKSVFVYFKRYFLYGLTTIITGILTTNACNLISINHSFLELVVKAMACVIIPNIIYTLVFFNTNEFQYLFRLIKLFLIRFKLIGIKSEESC